MVQLAIFQAQIVTVGIPVGSKNKKAAGNLSNGLEKITKTLVEKHGYPSVCRQSIINSEAFKGDDPKWTGCRFNFLDVLKLVKIWNEISDGPAISQIGDNE